MQETQTRLKPSNSLRVLNLPLLHERRPNPAGKAGELFSPGLGNASMKTHNA